MKKASIIHTGRLLGTLAGPSIPCVFPVAPALGTYGQNVGEQQFISTYTFAAYDCQARLFTARLAYFKSFVLEIHYPLFAACRRGSLSAVTRAVLRHSMN